VQDEADRGIETMNPSECSAGGQRAQVEQHAQ